MRLRILTPLIAAFLLVLTACGGDDSGSLEASLREAQERDASDSQDAPGDLGDLEDLFGGSDMEDLFGGEGLEDLFGGEGLEDLFGGEGLEDLFGGEGMEDLFGPMFGEDMGACMEFGFGYMGWIMTVGMLALGGDEAAIESANQQTRDLAASAPPEVRDDFLVVQSAMTEYFSEISGLTMSEMGDVDDPFSEPEVQAAQDNIDDWFEANCSFDESSMFGG